MLGYDEDGVPMTDRSGKSRSRRHWGHGQHRYYIDHNEKRGVFHIDLHKM